MTVDALVQDARFALRSFAGAQTFSVTTVALLAFAIRLALGAAPRDVLLLVLRRSAALVAIGVGAGLAVAVVATRVLRSLVFGVGTLDLEAFSLAAALLVVVALVASYLPARRATRISPMLALRGD